MKSVDISTRQLTVSASLLAALLFFAGCQQPIPFHRNHEGFLLNTDDGNVMLDGHDPVAFHFVSGEL